MEVVKINKGLTLEERVAFLELAVESLQMQKQQDERDEWDSPDGGVPLPDNHPLKSRDKKDRVLNTLLIQQRDPVDQLYTVKDLMYKWQMSERTIRGYYAEGAVPRLEPTYLAEKSVRFTLESITKFENGGAKQ